ncbi:hypothetical protein F511_33095 [Dorcoceras hygrometricum]|uniref:Uncharacterized protein n=1 Tax=Dorcoceras hygrometricum TaxID=472368 RepID=A0A2Z7AYW8_9LAMI|nr:hypothetical protein F511_33095 [Dorcoceras hygrometricum]
MASAYYSNTQHIDFESVLAMDDPEEAADAPQVKKAPRKPAVSTKRPAAADFEAPVVKKKRTMKKKSGSSKVNLEIMVVAQEAVPIQMVDSSTAAPAAADFEAPVVKKKRTMKKKSGSSKVNLEIMVVAQEAVPIQMVDSSTAAPAAEGIFTQPASEDEIPADPPADEVAGVTVDEVAADEGANKGTSDDDAAKQVLADTAQIIVDEEDQVVRTSGEGNQPAGTAEERHWFDLPYDDLIARWDAKRPVVTASDTDEDVETMDVGAAGGDQQVQFSEEEPEDMEMNDELIDADETMSLDEIILTIPAELSLPSSAREVTKITIGTEIKIPGVDEKTWYLASLPQIPVDDKGKEPLQLIDPIKGKPPQEHYYLICADIDLLVQLRENIIDEVAEFFYSFSLKRLAYLQIDDSYFAKEELVLSWAEAESTGVALQRKMYILLKYRAVLVRNYLYGWILNYVPGEGDSAVHLKVIDMISDLLSFVLDELKQQAVAHRIRWTRPCCSILFEGRLTSHRDIPAYTIFEVSSQHQYDDTLPLVSDFFKLLKKRWGDVCLEAVEFFASRRLLPVGSLNFCRALAIVERDSSFDYRQPTVFALRLYQFCTVYFHYSLFSRLTIADISSFVVASERTVLRNVQIAQNTVSVAPFVQLLYEHISSASTSETFAMHFDETDTATTVSSLPTVSTDLSTSLANLQTILSEHIDASQGGILSKLHKIEQGFCDSLRQQEEAFKTLIQGARQESRNIDNVQTLRFNEFRKNVLAQNASVFTGLTDVRKEVQEINAKVDIVTTGLNEVRKDVEATKEAISHLLLEFQSQAQANYIILTDQLGQLVDYINRDGNAKKGEGESSRGPQPL